VRQLPAGVTASLAIGVAALLACALELPAPLTRLAQDALVRSAVGAEAAPSAELPDVALVAIDPQSLRALPE
jgi:CHASE2 domain-containing sensor protein